MTRNQLYYDVSRTPSDRFSTPVEYFTITSEEVTEVCFIQHSLHVSSLGLPLFVAIFMPFEIDFDPMLVTGI